jgi:hypothetical protein
VTALAPAFAFLGHRVGGSPGLPGLDPRTLGGAAFAMLQVAPRLAGPPPTGTMSPAVPVALEAPVLSGLPWRSGSSCPEHGLAQWRGRALDVVVGFVEHDTWAAMLKHLRGSYFRNRARLAPQYVVSLPMLPRSEHQQHARCALGEFDDYFRQMGSLLVGAGAGDAVVRLGWEANHVSRPWGVSDAAAIPDQVACFRREVEALRSTAPGLEIEWTMGRRSTVPFNVLEMYPGDDVVDHLGVHYYDNVAPKIAKQAAWDGHYDAARLGGPAGLGRWLQAARARGKKLAVSEWGVWNQGSVAKSDNPVYVDNMYRFFQANVADIAYENYFNCPEKHRIGAAGLFPKASAKHRELWSAGQ